MNEALDPSDEQLSNPEMEFEKVLRPKAFEDFTGQKKVLDNLSIFVQAALKREEALDHFKLDPNKMTLVILGGSLGARAINQAIEKNIQTILKNDVQVIWQSGKLYYEEYKKFSEIKGVQVWEFIQQMDLLYAAADILISRAGAGSISELCIVGKPVIFIPSPNVAEDHQTKNAKFVTDKDAGILLKEENIGSLSEVINILFEDAEKRKTLSKNIKKLALPNATKEIADEVDKILK